MKSYKLFIITSQLCAHCDDFKENMLEYEKIWKKYPNIEVVKIDSPGRFDPGSESDNLRTLVLWAPNIILIERNEYERSRGVSGYRYIYAYIYGTDYKTFYEDPKRTKPLTVKGFKEFILESISD